MNWTEIPAYWFQGITRPEKTVEKMTKHKLSYMDGLKSIFTIGVIAGILIFVYMQLVASQIPLQSIKDSMVLVSWAGLIMAPVAAIAGLLLWSLLFRMVSSKLKGKSNFDQTCGMFGLWFGMMSIASIPAVIFSVIGALIGMASSNAIVMYLLVGIGALISTALSGITTGVLYDTIAGNEKFSIPRSGLLYGLSGGLASFILMLVFAIIASMYGLTGLTTIGV